MKRIWTPAVCPLVLYSVALASACTADDTGSGSLPTVQTDGGPRDTASQVDSGWPRDTPSGEDGGSEADGATVDADSDSGADSGDGGRDYSSDTTKFFGDSRCAQAGVQLCEDFESGNLDTATWTVVGTQPVVDGIQHARGSNALHITRNRDGLSFIKETKTFPAPNNTYFGRVFVYFQSLPTPPGMTFSHWTFIAASGTGVSGEIRVSGFLENNQTNNVFAVGTDNRVDPNGTGDWSNLDNDPNGHPMGIPLQKWVCIEWLHKGDTNETRFWWDATEHPSLYTSTTKHGGTQSNPYLLPQFTNVWLGWAEYQSSGETFELWMDEVAIDKERIGCVL
jgi:hypothetical protein